MALLMPWKNTMHKQCFKIWRSNSTIIIILLFCVVVMQYLILIGNDCGDVGVALEQQAPEVGTTEQTVNIPRTTEQTDNIPPDTNESTVQCLQDTTQKPESETVSNSDDKLNIYDWDKCTCGVHFRPDPDRVNVFPTRTDGEKKFLTIGIPTIKRRDEMYLVDTVKSLLSNMDDEEQNDTIIVIMLADNTPEKQQFIQEQVQEYFQNFIEQGVIHVIKPPLEYYSSLKVLKTTHNQGKDYVYWRSKQNFDYAFLMRYSATLSHYYLQLEDDVIAAKGFINLTRSFIGNQTTFWASLEFSELGFIGKLFKTQDLEQLSQLMLLFYQEQPGDEIFLIFNLLMKQNSRKVFSTSLFQHKGIFSSFPGKIQPLKDRFFYQMEKKFKGDNPPAYIYTTLNAYLNFVPKLAYAQTEGYFWTDGSPRVGDAFIVVFKEPQTIDRIIVETGSESNPRDILENAHLLASLTILKCPDRLECTNDINLGNFQNGKIDVQGVNIRVNFKVMCLQIKVLKEQTHWAIIREIAVFLFKGKNQP